MKRFLQVFMVIALCISVAAAIGLWYALHHVLPYTAIRPYRIQLSDVQRRFGSENPLRDSGIQVEPFQFLTRDSLHLSAWYIPAKNPVGTVLVMHGISSSKEMSWSTILSYHKRNFAVVAYDSRAHGASEGLNATMGFYEKYDVTACIDHLQKNSICVLPLVVHGFSMGGAIALQSLEVEPRIQAAIVEGAFCNLRETLYDYSGELFKIRVKWLNDIIFREAERIASFSVDEVRPEESLKRVRTPVLFIHGLEDEKISYHYAERNLQSLASSDKELMLIPGGTHLNLGANSAKEIDAKIDAFLHRAVTSTNSTR